MRNFEENFGSTVAWMDRDQHPAGLLKAGLQPTISPPPNRVSSFAFVRKTGWFGGLPTPPTVDMTGPPILAPEAFDSLIEDIRNTGFWSGCAYYMNHERNASCHGRAPNGGRLKQPVVFLHATWDLTCDSETSRLPEPMRELCSDLTEVTVETGHWLQIEKSAEVNAALCRSIVEKAADSPSEWPGFWDSGYTSRKSVV
jgi:soluble epoxide hydrolase/lipid-phosphate phosphatase